MKASLTLQEDHYDLLQMLLQHDDRTEGAAYLLCGKSFIASDPWDRQEHHKFMSYAVEKVPDEDIVSRSQLHITWRTDSFVRVLKQAKLKDLTVAIVHSHKDLFAFSEQDDLNEPDLVEIANHRNGLDASLLSLILMPSGEIIGRLWVSQSESIQLDLIRVVGNSIRLHYQDRGKGIPSSVLQRQALAFGEALNQDLSLLRIGIVGCGGTGSAVAMLLGRLGIGYIALFDKDTVEESNLNRLHGAFPDDVKQNLPKVKAIARSLSGLDVKVQTFQAWINEDSCQEGLKSCDIIFGCTDDHSGRLLLNRFAYYYATPIFDLGLALEVSNVEPLRFSCADGRVTVLMPKHSCLLCHGVIDPIQARDEDLKRTDPDEFERRKEEAYVLGEGNPSPAVVTFTTSVAIMAIEEFLHRLQGWRGENNAIANRVRKFTLTTDRKQGATYNPNCPICVSRDVWGLGDREPFLEVA
jgi:molybdopterin/thiamine biosynthesis adenylyltransferase